MPLQAPGYLRVEISSSNWIDNVVKDQPPPNPVSCIALTAKFSLIQKWVLILVVSFQFILKCFTFTLFQESNADLLTLQCPGLDYDTYTRNNKYIINDEINDETTDGAYLEVSSSIEDSFSDPSQNSTDTLMHLEPVSALTQFLQYTSRLKKIPLALVHK